MVLLFSEVAAEGGASERKLKANGSHPESPEKKLADVDMEEAPSWAKALMKKVDSVGDKVDEMATKVDDAVKIAKEAKDSVKLVEVNVAAFRGEMDSMKKDLNQENKERLDWQAAIDVRLTAAEFKEPMEDDMGEGSKIYDKIKQIEADVAKEKSSGIKDPGTPGQCSSLSIIAGLSPTSTFDKAAEWVGAQLTKHGVMNPIDMFIKDDIYKGRLWARFPTVDAMDAAIAMFSSKALTHEDSGKVWCNKDKPHHLRTARKFLADFKKLLIVWKFEKKAVKFDEESLTLSVEDKPVVQVSAKDDMLKLDWQDQEWENWQDVVGAKEFKELIVGSNEVLRVAKELRAKGKGKGKPRA